MRSMADGWRQAEKMAEATLGSSSPGGEGGARRRRVLLVEAERDVAASTSEQLYASGYEVAKVTAEQAAEAVRVFVPDVTLIVFGERESEGDLLALARALRINPATYALPLVFLFQQDGRTLRSAASQIGADDYFALATPRPEICARLDALFWRVEAGRRNAPVVGDQRAEIDNFLLLLDGVSADAQRGATGTLALVGALVEETGAGASEREQTLAEAHGFLKLNLRRVDAVAFYGPTILLVYLPHIDHEAAQAMLTRLRREFQQSRAASDLAFGLASFPADGVEVETLIEKAEAALNAARESDAASRIVVSQAKEPSAAAMATQTNTDAPPAPQVVEATTPLHTSERPASPFKPVDQLFREIRVADRPDTSSASRDSHVAGNLAGRAEPEASARVELRTGRAEAPSAQTHGTGTFAPRRLLLTVSDAARMSQLNLLIRSAGYEVRAAFDGQQALNLLRIERPDLLLVDYELHDMNGVEMLRRLGRQTGGRVKLPVVLLLPAQAAAARGEALECGARGIINLPYNAVELLDCMRSVISLD